MKINRRAYVKNGLWEKYGLCVLNGVQDFFMAVKCHDQVVNYLEQHPNIAEDYLVSHRYFDILSLSEKDSNHNQKRINRMGDMREATNTRDGGYAFWHNIKHFHHRMIARYLKRRGWVVFYLEEKYRTCDGETCWLKLYQSEEKR